MGPSECSVQKGKGSSRWEYQRANIARRHGFTLVELLVVIVIIGILAAIITPVAFNALGNARNAAISLELSKLSAALEAYKNEYGSYPPDMTNELQTRRHLSRLFPRQDLHEKNDLVALKLDPAEALVFWLRGFYPDPEHPLFGDSNHDEQPDMERGTAFYEFPLAQLTDIDGDNLPEYSPPYCKRTPVVYFVHGPDHYHVGTNLKKYVLEQDINEAKPYIRNVDDARHPYGPHNSFQLICAGQDGRFGSWRDIPNKIYPTGQGYDPKGADDDNITNFSNGKTLESAKLD